MGLNKHFYFDDDNDILHKLIWFWLLVWCRYFIELYCNEYKLMELFFILVLGFAWTDKRRKNHSTIFCTLQSTSTIQLALKIWCSNVTLIHTIITQTCQVWEEDSLKMSTQMNCVRHRLANGLLGRPVAIYKSTYEIIPSNIISMRNILN